MKLLLMSDSHQNYSAVRDVVTRHRYEVDAFVHLGDGIREFLDVMKDMDCSNYYFIAGNNEEGTIYCQSPDYKIITIDEHRILITHGNKYENKLDLLGVAHIASMNNAEIALCGHTHVAEDEMIHGIRVINPGALRYWRDGFPGYTILSISEYVEAEFIEYWEENNGSE